MEPNEFRLPAVAGLVLVVMMAAAFAMDLGIIGSTGANPEIRMDRLGEDLVRVQESALWPVEAWTYTLMVLPAAIFLVGLYGILRRRTEGLPAMGVLLALGLWIVHTAHNVAILAVVQTLAPAYVPGAANAAALEATALGFLGVGAALSPLSGLGAVILVAAALSLGIAILKSDRLSRWNGYLLLGVVILAGLGLLRPLSDAFIMLGLVGWILLILWHADVAVILWRQGTPNAPRFPRPAKKPRQAA